MTNKSVIIYSFHYSFFRVNLLRDVVILIYKREKKMSGIKSFIIKNRDMFTIFFGLLLCAAIIIPILVIKPSEDEPIIIRSNDDFKKYNLSGSGTSIDPYIIENKTIITSSDYSILVADVTDFFIIRNNNLQASAAGITISLVAANRTQLINNTCTNSQIGIYIYNTPGCYIFGNNCSNNFDDGINVDSFGDEEVSEYCTIVNNTCINNFRNSIIVWYSPHAVVENNTCIMTNKNVKQIWHRCGLVLSDSPYAIVRNNIIINTGVQFYGQIIYVISMVFENNLINGKAFGLFYDTNNITIDSSNYGQLFLFNCSDIVIKDQNIIDTFSPLELSACSNVHILNNTFNYNYKYGIVLRGCEDVMIETTDSSHNYIGAYLRLSTNVTIESSTFTNNYWGCYVYQSTYTLTGNTFSDNVEDFEEV